MTDLDKSEAIGRDKITLEPFPNGGWVMTESQGNGLMMKSHGAFGCFDDLIAYMQGLVRHHGAKNG